MTWWNRFDDLELGKLPLSYLANLSSFFILGLGCQNKFNYMNGLFGGFPGCYQLMTVNEKKINTEKVLMERQSSDFGWE